MVRIVGRPPLQATVFEMERLRCNGCGEVFTASDPQSAGPEKFDATAVATTALLKYGTGMPFNRLEQLEKHLGIPFPASVQWELMKRAAGLLRLVLNELIRQAAQGSVMHNDDTGMRILRLARNTDDGRTGTFTSGIVSIWREWRIALYFTGWKHAGENLADVLKQRAGELNVLIRMCDALSRNTPKLSGVQILLSIARKKTVRRHCPELPGGVPLCAGSAGRGLLQRCPVTGTEDVCGRTARVSSGTQWPGDDTIERVADGATGGAQDRTELRTGQGDLLSAATLDEADAVSAATGRATR
jgi:transposase